MRASCARSPAVFFTLLCVLRYMGVSVLKYMGVSVLKYMGEEYENHHHRGYPRLQWGLPGAS